jgi:two-component system phosphoglycerate transport system response regulator PgtA
MARGIANHRLTQANQLLARRRVLLVDEDCEDLQGYCAVLEQGGYEVQACRSYVEGAQRLTSGVFDFVIICQGSGAFEGRPLLERVMMIDRHTPVLILTRAVDMNCYIEAMQLGAVDYVEKPLPPAEMLRIVETHLRSRAAGA